MIANIYSNMKLIKNYKVLALLLAVTNIFTGVLLVQRTNSNVADNFENPYPLIDIARNFIDQEDVIVNIQPLRDSLEAIYDEYGEESISLYIEYLNSGANISYNQDSRYYPASLIKMPVAIAAAKKIQDGDWDWDSKLIIFEEDVDTRFGNIGLKPIGTRLTIEELLTELLTKSDNTAYKMLLRNLGSGPVNDFLTKTGLNEFFDQDLNITAKEYTRLFRSLYTSNYLSRKYSEKILELLSQSERNYLGLGIPEEITYSHKFGENGEENIFADSGIVYIPSRPYVVTVLFKGNGGEEKEYIDGFFEKISTVIFNYFNDYRQD